MATNSNLKDTKKNSVCNYELLYIEDNGLFGYWLHINGVSIHISDLPLCIEQGCSVGSPRLFEQRLLFPESYVDIVHHSARYSK